MRFLLHEAREVAIGLGRTIIGTTLVVAGVALAHVWGTGLLEIPKAFGFGC